MTNKTILSWAVYDWANSAYATAVMAGFFPLFFRQYWGSDLDTTESTFYLGAANAVASLIVVLIAPLLGALADFCGRKKRILVVFTLIGSALTFSLPLVEQGQWLWALTIYVGATVGFMGTNIPYDALLVNVAPKEKRDWVSALGYSLGYVGGGILFSFCIALTQWPEIFGFADSAAAAKASFVLVALWWLVFTLPLILLVDDKPKLATPNAMEAITKAWRGVKTTVRQLRAMPATLLFLIAYWFYIDGVDTVVRMAVDYGLALGLNANDLILALLITQFVGFPAALIYGKLGHRIGAKNAILIGIGAYIAAIALAYFIETTTEFYALAVFIGLFQGGIQALSRSLYSTLIPQDQAGQFFGFYNMFGKFAAVIGPLLMGVTGLLLEDTRASLLSVLLLFIVGGALLWKVKVPAPP